jgi:NitT/TauT family transport system permease protein
VRRRRASRLGALGVASPVLLLVLWQAAAMRVADPLLPGPVAVAAAVWRLAMAGELLTDFGLTLLRSVVAFAVAMLFGTAMGVLLGRVHWLDRLFSSWVLVALNMPAVIIGILVYIWLGLTDLALVLAVVLSKTPLVITTVRQGVRALRPEFEEIAKALALPLPARLGDVVLPQLVPYLLAAARNGLALVWKLVLVFEVLGSDGGVGFRIAMFFQTFDVVSIMAYAVCFIAIVLAVEALLLGPLERRLLGWQTIGR